MTQPGDNGASYGYPQRGYGRSYAQTRAWPPQYSPQAHFERLGYPAPAPPRQGGARTVRSVLAGTAGLAVAAIGIGLATGAGHGAQLPRSGSAGASTQATARLGSAITLSGNGSGEQMAVQVTKVIARARPGDQLTSASAGARLYAVQFRLRDSGSAAYSAAPSNGAVVTDSLGQSYGAVIADTVAGCPSFPATVSIAPGSSGLGCIVFEVPKAAKITRVQFTLDSGLGPDTGQWNVG